MDVTGCCVLVYFMTRCVQGEGSVWSNCLLGVGLFHDTVCAGGWICVDVTDCCVSVYFMARCVQGDGSVWM